MKLSQIREKFWIRKDRENVFFSGLIVTCICASIATTYWHFYDRTELRPKIKMNNPISKEKEYKELKETEISMAGLKIKRTTNTYASPDMPEPGQ